MSNTFNNFLNFHPPTAYPTVHPVQETSGNLTKLEQELQTMAQAEQVAKEVEVVVGNAGVV